MNPRLAILQKQNLRRQSSLESILDFQPEAPLNPAVRDRARHRFYQVVGEFEGSAGDSGDNSNTRNTGGRPCYVRSRLIRQTYDHALSHISQDNFLRAFFSLLELPMDGADEPLDKGIRARFFGFADYLFNNSFLPFKASPKKAPQPTPAFHSAVQQIELRGAGFVRTKSEYLPSGVFDCNKTVERFKDAGNTAQDEEGHPLKGQEFEAMEVAHILPHSLTRLRPHTSSPFSKGLGLSSGRSASQW
ncbi:uncharacterized protein C8A04DRAFT_38706 [Dichotomopilus funicola]|uniref:Uncharacterized protein n=1 Tax=Dichotomopilus funicola TaxID=1934379 RepID=A0AAN6ZLE6_9PEZI|nr:hypothetical protein C8A04DRAFT_38706 [Dichotomopilus funicola]